MARSLRTNDVARSKRGDAGRRRARGRSVPGPRAELVRVVRAPRVHVEASRRGAGCAFALRRRPRHSPTTRPRRPSSVARRRPPRVPRAGGDGDGSRDAPRALRRAPRVALPRAVHGLVVPVRRVARRQAVPRAEAPDAPRGIQRQRVRRTRGDVRREHPAGARRSRSYERSVRTRVRATEEKNGVTRRRTARHETFVFVEMFVVEASVVLRVLRVVVVVRVFVARARRELGARRPQHRVGAARSARAPTLPLPVVSPAEQLAARRDRRGVPRAVRKRSHYGVAFFFFLCPGARRGAVSRLRARAPEGTHSGAFPFPPRERERFVARARSASESESVSLSAPGNRPAEKPPARARDEKETSSDASASGAEDAVVVVASAPVRRSARVVVVGSRRAHPHARGHVPVQVVPQAERAAPVAPQQKSAPSAATHALPWRDAATETTRRLTAVPDGDSEKRSTRRIGVSNQAARAPSFSNDETRPVRVSNAREPPTPPTPPGKNFAASARGRRVAVAEKRATPRAATRRAVAVAAASAGLDPATSGRKRAL